MDNTNTYQIDSIKPFSKSLIWQLNRDYYQQTGIEAWRDGTVPHHLERLVSQVGLDLPKYCYVISDIVGKNLNFFLEHPQFQDFFEKGILDVAYFDAVESTTIELRYAKSTILPQDLNQPVLVLANYFFDSLPMDLFYFKDKNIFTCSVSLDSSVNPEGMDTATLIKNIATNYYNFPLEKPCYENPILNEILEEYRELVFDTYLFFPTMGFKCIQNLQRLSKKGMMLISMDKGFHEIHEIENSKQPDMITHGSLSFWVNYHALGAYCEKHHGKALFPTYASLHLELACLFFLPEPDTGAYDSTMFRNLLPHIKNLSKRITVNDRTRLAQTMHRVWEMYFTLNEDYDMAFDIGGVFYSLGYYKEALNYFAHSVKQFGEKPDIFYNSALCYYHLRQDDLFLKTVTEAKAAFPNYENFAHLDKLDLTAT